MTEKEMYLRRSARMKDKAKGHLFIAKNLTDWDKARAHIEKANDYLELQRKCMRAVATIEAEQASLDRLRSWDFQPSPPSWFTTISRMLRKYGSSNPTSAPSPETTSNSGRSSIAARQE